MEKVNEKLSEAAADVQAVLDSMPSIAESLRSGRIEEMITVLETDAVTKLTMAKDRIEKVIAINKKFAGALTNIMSEVFK